MIKIILRWLTLLVYFAPFTFFLVTCNNFGVKLSYNKREAAKNILIESQSQTEYDAALDTIPVEKNKVDSVAILDSLQIDALSKQISADSLVDERTADYKEPGSFRDEGIRKILMPTPSSLSGIGAAFYFKNKTGQISIAISLVLSLTLLIAFKFIQSTGKKIFLLSLNIFCLLAFMIDGFISDVSLLWGAWVLLILLLVQWTLEYISKNKLHADNS